MLTTKLNVIHVTHADRLFFLSVWVREITQMEIKGLAEPVEIPMAARKRQREEEG